MATKPETNAEALQQIIQQQDKLRVELKDALAKQDSKKAQKLYDEIWALDSKKRSMATAFGIPIGAIGSGLQSGLMGALTFPMDALPMLHKAITGDKRPLPSETVGSLFKEYFNAPSLNIQNEPASMESAVPFRAAQGFAGVTGPGVGPKMVAASTAVSAADAAMGDEGMLQLAFGGALLTAGGFKALKSMRDNSRMKEFVKGLPSNEQNAFSRYMMTGQGSDDPQVAAAIQKLSTDTKYAELFAKLREGATKAATAGVSPAASKIGEAEATTAAATGIAAKLEGLRKNITEGASSLFERAKGYGANRDIVNTDNTLNQIDKLIIEFGAGKTDDARSTVAFLNRLRDSMKDGGGWSLKTKMTVEEAQKFMQEFGVQAGQGESLIKDVSLGTQTRIASALFGAMKDDVRASKATILKSADYDMNDVKALDLLNAAREKTRIAAQKYNDVIAQGLPAFLKNNPLNTITPEQLHLEYMKLNKGQRDLVRSFLSGTDDEALKFIDKKIFDDFVASARSRNPDGTFGTNLEALATKWDGMKPAEKDAIAQALGTNFSEFDKRMKDAQVFTRRMQVAQPSTQELIPQQQVANLEAVVGATPAGYAGAKQARTILQTINVFGDKAFNGLSDEQLMKVLLTDEGKAFLKQAKLSPNSAKTLEALTKVESAVVPAYAGGRILATPAQQTQQPIAPVQPEAPSFQISDEDLVPAEDTMQPAQPTQPKSFTISDEDLVLQ